MEFKFYIKEVLNIELTLLQERKFIEYFHFLIKYNETTNLTRITEKKEVFFKHFFDSLTLVRTIDFNDVQSICDMGAGAGFPSIPLKIIYPHLEVTIVDSLNKRIEFLKQLVEKLQLDKIKLIHNRAEVFALENQEEFDIVTARALGKMSMICEMGLPMTKIDGKFIAMKGLKYSDELKDARKGIKTLGGEVEIIDQFELPYNFGLRVQIVINKKERSSGYPRSFSIIKKNPL